jgi:uncharacterized protein YhdP
MLNSLPIRLLWHSLSWLTRLAIVVSAFAAVLIAFSIMALRYWLLPDIEQYHDRITSSLSAAIGNPVTIGRIQGEWRGFLPHLNFTDVRILDDHRQTALAFKRIDGSLSWMSLFTAELRLASLEIDRPELLIRRDTEGKFFIGNLALSRKGDNNDLSDWLLHQSNLVVRNALIVWIDGKRGAPPLVLQQVNLRIHNLFSKHSFALQAIPPNELSTPLDVRGEFYGSSFDNLGDWHGRLYTRLDYTDVTAWRPWLDLPGEFSRGRGALRGWLGINNGKVTQVTADLDLRDVVTRLGDDLPEMTLLELRGRASWQQVAGGFEVSTRNLAMKLQDGLKFKPTDFYFRTVDSGGQQAGSKTSSGEMRANLLGLKDLAELAKYLPMKADLRERLDAYAPRGVVSNLDAQWQGSPGTADNYKLKAHFENLAVKQVGKTPGFSGLTGNVDGSETSGRLSINSRRMIVDAPGVMREPLSFSTLIGQAGWQHKNGELAINVDNIAVTNNDLAGNFFGSYHTQAGTLGVLDLTGKLTRGDIRRTARYTPLIALDRAGNDWLSGALLAGHTEDFRIRIKGNLSDFPPGGTTRCANASSAGVLPPRLLPQREGGSEAVGNPPAYSSRVRTADCASNVSEADGKKNVLFEIGGHAQDVVMEFDKNWPRIENISGEFMIRGSRLDVESPSATILDTHLRNVTVTIPDLTSKDPVLEIKGEATGASNSFLNFVQKSPVRGYIDKFTDGVRATGSGKLGLSARIPLSGDQPVKVSGSIKVQDNNIDLGKDVPLLRNTRGTLMFTESGMHANGVSAEILGGKASINVQNDADGGVHVTVKGRSNVDALRRIETYPVLDYLHGITDWDANISANKNSAHIIIKSDLQGISSSLPQPFAKSANDVLPLRLEKNPVLILPKQSKRREKCTEPCPGLEGTVAEGQDVITASLGNLLSARLERQNQGGTMMVKRGTVSFGARGKSHASNKSKKLSRGRDGVWLFGDLPELSVEGWGGLAGGADKAGKSNGKIAGVSASHSAKPADNIDQAAGYGTVFPIAGANLRIEKLTGYGQRFSKIHVTAGRRGDGLAARLSSKGLNGEVVWEPHGYNTGSLFRARLSNLQWSGEAQAEVPSPSIEPFKPAPVKTGSAGKTHPGNIPAVDISIENLYVREKHIGRFELIGHPENKDWLLRRLNITNPDGRLVGSGVWSDAQGQLQTQLNMMLDISDAGKILDRSGYPNTVKGGSGRLVADLSWPGTPDEYSSATLNGTLKLDTGKGQFLKMDPGAGKLLSVLSLQDLPKHIALGFTDVFSEGFQFDNINGKATIKDGVIESQDFHIYGSSAKVTLKGKVDLKNETQNLTVRILPTLGDSVSLISAFAISPVVGIGSLIVNKVLGNPLDKLASFEYNVSGSWSNPSVIKAGGVATETKQSNPGK